METLTQTSPATAAALRALAAGKLRWTLNHLLNSFGATPDDKLDFKPSASAKSPRELAQHMISANGLVAQCFGMESAPKGDYSELGAEAAAIVDRNALAERLKNSTEAIISHIEGLSDEAMDTMVPFLSGPVPMPMFLLLDEWHISRHAGQLDYIQTIYGDLEDRF